MAKRQGRPRGSKLDAHEGFLLALVDETDDITLAEMQARLRTERDVSVGLGTLWRFFARRAVTDQGRWSVLTTSTPAAGLRACFWPASPWPGGAPST